MFNKIENSESPTKRAEKKLDFFQKSNFETLNFYVKGNKSMTKRLVAYEIALIVFCLGSIAVANDVNVNEKLAHRMGTLVVKTVPGAKITVKQQSHEFPFGTATGKYAFC